MRNKFHEFKNYVLENNFTAIAVSETWLDCSNDNNSFLLPNYNFVRRDRLNRGGGVALYISSALKYCVLDPPIDDSSGLEYLIVKLTIKKLHLVVGVL